MQTYVDNNSPRHRLPFAELPRGYVKFPVHIVQGSRTCPAMERITRDRALSGTRWPGMTTLLAWLHARFLTPISQLFWLKRFRSTKSTSTLFVMSASRLSILPSPKTLFSC